MNLGNKIRELRKTKNLTQEQLAASLNISAQAVSKWEMGASYPDITMIPVLAGLFKVSLDELFDFDVNSIDKEIEEIIMEYKKYFWSNFEKAEKILQDGLNQYPASIRLKTELFELYSYNADRGEEFINNAFELANHIITVSQDIFCTCRTKNNMVLIYKYLENVKGEDHYDEIKKIIESLPYMYPYMLQDRMRLSACYIKGEEGMREAVDNKVMMWQEFFIACDTVAQRYFVIERFMYPDKQGYNAYPIGGTHANHAITLLQIAACKYRLDRTEDMDEIIEKAKHIYFDVYTEEDFYTLNDYKNEMSEMAEYFTKEYNKMRLNEYKPIDLEFIKERIK